MAAAWKAVTTVVCLLAAPTLALAETASPPASPSAARLAPQEAGARYGQALGVALVCYGLRTRDKAMKALVDAYPDVEEHRLFQAEADKVLESWQNTNSCKNSGGPNGCLLSHVWSCRDALTEIGPQGSKLPGLIEAPE